MGFRLHKKATERFTRRLYLLPIERINVSRHVLERLNEEVPGGATSICHVTLRNSDKICMHVVRDDAFLIDSYDLVSTL